MGLSLESMAIEMPAVFGHPNRVAFRGVLTLVDVASDRAPAGGRGHRVLLTKKAAEKAIPSLLGMALDYSPKFDAHDTRRKIGVITRAEIVGREIVVGGFLYGRDFPELVEAVGGRRSGGGGRQAMDGVGIHSTVDRSAARIGRATQAALAGDGARATQAALAGDGAHATQAALAGDGAHATQPALAGKGTHATQAALAGKGTHAAQAALAGEGARATQAQLGMSYEIADAVVEDIKAAVWVLNRVTFTGAAVLRRDKAAYQATWIELE